MTETDCIHCYVRLQNTYTGTISVVLTMWIKHGAISGIYELTTWLQKESGGVMLKKRYYLKAILKKKLRNFSIFIFLSCVCLSLCLLIFQLFHSRFQTNNCIIFFNIWWLGKVKNSTVYFIRKFCSSITDCIFITTFWAQVIDILINDLICMMQVVYLHKLGKLRWGKIHACCSLPRLKNCIPLLVIV